MATKIGINGFGRIGRLTLRTILDHYPGDLEVVAVNDLADTNTNAHLFKYDSTYGPFKGSVEPGDGLLKVNGNPIRSFSAKDPSEIAWSDVGAQIILESTGLFTAVDAASRHLGDTVKKVIVSAPLSKPTDDDLTLVLGVNDDQYDPSRHHVVSNASCTTNCLAPMVKVLVDSFGVEAGLMTTIHSYTNDQKVQDQFHKDLRRARAAAANIIPTSTGAAKAIGLVVPEMKGKMHGIALRVPTATVSVTDLVVTLSKDATADAINDAYRKAAGGRMKGILAVSDEPLVSSDYIGNPYSCTIDADLTLTMGERMAKVAGWYDNEWGYAVRCADVMKLFVDKGL